MGALRWTAAAVTALVAAFLWRELVVEPYRCNIAKAELQKSTTALLSMPAGPRTASAVREGLARARHCLEVTPWDVEMHMILAVHYRLLGRLEEAARAYEEALRFDHRPELYFSLGMVELEMNRRAEAVTSFAKASAFDFKYTLAIPDDSVVSEVVATVLRTRRMEQAATGDGAERRGPDRKDVTSP